MVVSERTEIYGHGILDYKYRMVWSALHVDFHPTTFWKWIRVVWTLSSRNRKIVFHIRYLLWKGYIATFPLYILLILTCKLKRIPVLWTCHNIRTHDIPSSIYDGLLRNFIARTSTSIIVLHKSLKEYLPKTAKIDVACFGRFSLVETDDGERSPDFQESYRLWRTERNIEGPDIVFIGEYSPFKGLNGLFEFAQSNKQFNILIVCPKLPDHLIQRYSNIFIWPEKVMFELHNILSGSHKLVGFVGHDNVSLPTAIHLFSSYGIPCVMRNVEPMSTIACEWKIGPTFDCDSKISECVDLVRKDYLAYSGAARRYIAAHTWAKAQSVHQKVLREIGA